MQEQQQGSAPAGEPTPDTARVMQQGSPREVVITRIARAAAGQLAQELQGSPREVVINPAGHSVSRSSDLFHQSGACIHSGGNHRLGIIYMVIIMIFGGTFMGGMGGRHCYQNPIDRKSGIF